MSTKLFLPSRIVSGGQTGVDRAALEIAIAHGIPHGGWCPKGRLSEDGSIPSRYELTEMANADYPARTEQNVIDSDATLILYEGKLKGGTLLTRRFASQWNKPHLCLNMQTEPADSARRWLFQQQPEVLNVAGPRESSHPQIQSRAFDFLLDVFRS